MSKLIAINDARAKVEAAVLGVPIKWPNEDFQLPDPPVPYIAVEISSGHDRPIEIGSNATWEVTGQLWFHVFAPVRIGYVTVFTIQDSISAIFRDASTSAVVYDQIRDDPGDYGGENGNFWRSSVTIDWRLQTRVV